MHGQNVAVLICMDGAMHTMECVHTEMYVHRCASTDPSMISKSVHALLGSLESQFDSYY